MTKPLIHANIIVKKSKAIEGYGVFANQTFNKGDIIEECYILVGRGFDKTLENYYFDVDGKYGIFLGYGMIYNHAEDPNTDYRISKTRGIATFKANRRIKKGEEITISYGDQEWFKDRRMKLKAAKA